MFRQVKYPFEEDNIADLYPAIVESMKLKLEEWVISCRECDSGFDCQQ